ncbi:hypothetical protein THI4931_01800 [Pandoraea sputorum]|nr:hypothetical protein THI4931_01800 [Pandoraea sputorum]
MANMSAPEAVAARAKIAIAPNAEAEMAINAMPPQADGGV